LVATVNEIAVDALASEVIKETLPWVADVLVHVVPAP
jgi:hypothetical protein